jgi:hypothetical protein
MGRCAYRCCGANPLLVSIPSLIRQVECQRNGIRPYPTVKLGQYPILIPRPVRGSDGRRFGSFQLISVGLAAIVDYAPEDAKGLYAVPGFVLSLLYATVLWRREGNDLGTKDRAFRPTHRQRSIWQVGFLF